jgi:G:T-mismatch repair DNA endonuclease (very short patch repair protein)
VDERTVYVVHGPMYEEHKVFGVFSTEDEATAWALDKVGSNWERRVEIDEFEVNGDYTY